MKKLLIFFVAVTLVSIASANSLDIEFPSGNNFEAGTPVTFKVTLYDDSGAPIDGQIDIIIEDSAKRRILQTVSSKQIATIDLGEGTASGQGVITASFQDIKTIAFFEIGRQELASFELNENNNLIVKNIGNTPYTRTIQITIGETTGTQEANLEIGESTTYILIAPDGVYNIRVTDGQTSLIRSDVRLTGTGNVIGAIDDSASRGSPITSNPDQGDELSLVASLQRNKFIYVFVAVIFGAMILIAIERRYKKNVSRK